jgi:hypothetical protein
MELYDELGLCLGLDPARMDKPAGWFAEELKGGSDFAAIRDSPPRGRAAAAAKPNPGLT